MTPYKKILKNQLAFLIQHPHVAPGLWGAHYNGTEAYLIGLFTHAHPPTKRAYPQENLILESGHLNAAHCTASHATKNYFTLPPKSNNNCIIMDSCSVALNMP